MNNELDFLSDKIEDSAPFSEDSKLTSAGSTKIPLLSMQIVKERTKVADYDSSAKQNLILILILFYHMGFRYSNH